MKIFLLEDDYSLNQVIKSSLEDHGYFVTSCLDGYEGVSQVLNHTFDIYILDINVPGFDGHQVLEIIRKEHKLLPVIIISAAMDIENIKKAYDLGCNDYLKKPFDFEELFLHVSYIVKTIYHENSKNNIIDLGYGFEYNLEGQTLSKHSHQIELTQNEKLLLDILLKNRGITVSIESIHNYVWGDKDIEAVSMRSLIHKLQKKLRNGMIINIRGIGYKLLKI
jgi:DNA-binding response OmpR family regulator